MPMRRRGNPSARKGAPPGGGQQALPTLVPQLSDVMGAIQSLYAEELRPFGRILRKRIGEIAGAGRDQVPDVDAKALRHICDTSDLVRVEQEEGGDWSAVLTAFDLKFIDVYSSEDPYPPELWQQASAYFANLTGDDMVLPGGRYSCAQVLARRNLPFFAGRSLGQLSHIVQLAISQRKILGYLNGSLVPYANSQSMVKEQCAVWQQPCSGAVQTTLGMPLATVELARNGLREILDNSAGPRPATMPLSNVKRIFRSRFHLELSETALGHSKLCELLQDKLFADICSVRLEWNGYIVVQNDSAIRPPGAVGAPLGMPAPPALARVVPAAPAPPVVPQAKPGSRPPPPAPPAASAPEPPAASEPRRVMFCVEEPLELEDAGEDAESGRGKARVATPGGALAGPYGMPSTKIAPGGDLQRIVANTFIHAPLPPLTPLPGARPRAMSTPPDFGTQKDAWEASCNALSYQSEPVENPGGTMMEGDASARSRLTTFDLGEKNKDEAGSEAPTSPSVVEEGVRRPMFCPDEPLDMEGAGLTEMPAPKDATGKEKKVGGFQVKNGFLHMPPPLPTPLVGQKRRAQSADRIGAKPLETPGPGAAGTRGPTPLPSPGFPQTPWSPLAPSALLSIPRSSGTTPTSQSSPMFNTKLALEVQAESAGSSPTHPHLTR